MDNALNALREAALEAKAWPFDEAKKLLPRVDKALNAKGYVLFETGYGPSGLPHIGTFGEVARTTMVRRAFRLLTGDSVPTQLFCVSDDMDGMRKIPDNVPNHEMLKEHLQKPLTDVPDPFGTHESFGAHNNARLRAFLDSFGFEYTFKSATELYRSGALDAMLLRALGKFDEIMAVMLPTLGPERQKTYSPFLPISPKTGRVLYVPMKRIDAAAGTVTFDDEDGEEMTLPVTGGRCKMQWKPDFGMRWAGLGVDFEMYGKDHLTNGVIYSKICSILGAEPPVQFNYELFLDDKGEKISKSKGNGISVEQWLTYASPESLALFMYQKPKTAKRLYFDVIPKAVDDYAAFLEKYDTEEGVKRLESPIFHIHGDRVPAERFPVSFALLLNLVSASGTASSETLWGFIRNYAPGVSPEKNKKLDELVGYAVRYYEDFVKPTKRYRRASDKERAALEELAAALDGFVGEKDAEKIQFEIYEIGKRHAFEPLRDWFKAIYEVAFGQEQGPRFGTFAAIYGPRKAADLIRRALAGEFVKVAA
ncbi:MAG: lysine--tRNA ligase [Alphaproteobacteria bacterium]|nr:lysine--tRNA ligase [Alphaproteobacteria bacterium]